MKGKRYHYSTVGYGVFTRLGELYSIFRVEIYDNENESPYSVSEAICYADHETAGKIRDFFDNLETDFPVYINMGSSEWCQKAVKEHLGVDDLQ